jgi:hypothetical protein
MLGVKGMKPMDRLRFVLDSHLHLPRTHPSLEVTTPLGAAVSGCGASGRWLAVRLTIPSLALCASPMRYLVSTKLLYLGTIGNGGLRDYPMTCDLSAAMRLVVTSNTYVRGIVSSLPCRRYVYGLRFKPSMSNSAIGVPSTVSIRGALLSLDRPANGSRACVRSPPSQRLCLCRHTETIACVSLLSRFRAFPSLA